MDVSECVCLGMTSLSSVSCVGRERQFREVLEEGGQEEVSRDREG